jgi:hypothetical protein
MTETDAWTTIGQRMSDLQPRYGLTGEIEWLHGMGLIDDDMFTRMVRRMRDYATHGFGNAYRVWDGEPKTDHEARALAALWLAEDAVEYPTLSRY